MLRAEGAPFRSDCVDESKVAVVGRPRPGEVLATVGGPVVGQNDLPRLVALLGIESLQLLLEPGHSIADGYDHADHGT